MRVHNNVARPGPGPEKDRNPVGPGPGPENIRNSRSPADRRTPRIDSQENKNRIIMVDY